MALKKVYVTKKVTFESAHHLNNYDGKCSRVHGHSYKLEATFCGNIDTSNISDCHYACEAMVCDFSYLKKLLNKVVVDKYDHCDLNLFFEQPTAEVMAIRIFEYLKKEIGNSNYEIYSVRLWETKDSYAEYRGEVV